MKKLTYLFVLAIAFFSCKENEAPESVFFPKKVLVENFMGVQCLSCPGGNDELESLIDLFGDDLIVVSIHSDDFGFPFSTSQFDFRTPEAEEITEYIGRPLSYPSAVINRKDFDGGDYFLPLAKNYWAGFINQEIEQTPKLNVNISKTYDSVSRELTVQVSGSAEVDIIGGLNLTVMITENNIEDSQVVEANGVVENYIHMHVLKTTMTNSTGDELATNLLVGESYEKNYSMTLPEEWNAENCEVIAFVNLIDGQNKEVLQAESVQVEN